MQFGKVEAAGYYYGSLVNNNATRHQYMTKIYGEEFMQETQESICKWATWIVEKVKEREGKKNPVGKVPAPFCVMQNINEGWELPEDVA